MKKKEKPSYDRNRQTLGEIYPLSAPFTIILDSSEACNFRCSYCFRASDDRNAWGTYTIKKNIMSWEIFQCAVGQIKEFQEDVKHISLSHHGEPLCNRHLPEMVRYIKSQSFSGRLSIHTNGSLLDEAYAIELAESGIDKIVISLQGLDEQSYRDVCGAKIDYEEFYRNLQRLYEYKRSSTTINIKIVDLAVGGRQEEFYDRFSPIADAVFIEKAVPIWKNVGSDVTPKTMQNKYGMEFPVQSCCPLIFNTLVVSPDGDVYPCTQILSKERLGNIAEHSLCELWNGAQRRELLRRQLLLCPPESCDGCYIKQNSIFAEEDMIDGYREEILERLMANGS